MAKLLQTSSFQDGPTDGRKDPYVPPFPQKGDTICSPYLFQIISVNLSRHGDINKCMIYILEFFLLKMFLQGNVPILCMRAGVTALLVRNEDSDTLRWASCLTFISLKYTRCI